MREEKKAEKRQELVGVCLDCFVEKGLTVATTKDLCKAAKLQNGGIYYYFSTKEEIVLACAEEAISRIEKAAFAIVLEDDKDPSVVIEERGMKQVSDTGAIEAVVDGVLAAFPDKVEQYKAGKTGLLGFFVGQCMKQMKGQGNPKVINQLLAQKLS